MLTWAHMMLWTVLEEIKIRRLTKFCSKIDYFSMLESSFRTPELNNRGKRKWPSDENLSREEQEAVVTDNLQTPQNKRLRREEYRQAHTPLQRVAAWVRETAKKTVKIFTSFRDKYWRDELEDQENEIISSSCEHTTADMQRNRQLNKDELCVTQVQEETPGPSYWRKKPVEENFSQYRHYEPSSSRKLYDPTRYSTTNSATVSTRDELWLPSSPTNKEERYFGFNDRLQDREKERKEIKANAPKTRNMTAYKIKRHPTTVDNVVRLQEREQYMKLLAHYTSVDQPNYSSVRRKPIVIEDEDEKKATSSTKWTSQPRHSSVLSSESHYVPNLSSSQNECNQPVTVKLQPSPLKTSCSDIETSQTLSATASKGIFELQPNNRSSRRSFDLLDDSWIKKWKEALSTEHLEQQRKIAKEKLKLEAMRKKRNDFDVVSQQIKERMQGKREIPEEKVDTFQELTDEMNDVIDKALGHGAVNDLLVELSIGRITRGDIITLRPQTWLNDEVVNAYFYMIADRSKTSGPKVHAFNTFFYPKLMKTGHASLRRWTKKVDLFAMDIVLIPIHLGMHWCLAVIDIKRKVFTYYDSLKGDNPACIQALRDYICAESLDKKKTNLDLTGWKNDSPKNIPEQLNGCDCGVFACKYADYVSRRAAFNFTQHHMPYFRRRMVYEILKKKLL